MEDDIDIVARRLKRTLFAFMMVLLLGTIGYQMVAENVSWFDALYMTVVTVTTIGYSEVIALDDNFMGRVFTIIIAFLGIGIITYGFSNLAALFIERDLSKPFKIKRMEREIKKMEQHYVICGGSQVGIQIANELESTQRPFVIGDLDPDLVEQFNKQFKYGKALEGDCSEDAFLEKLNIQTAKGAFITTRDDNLNLVICVTIKQLQPQLRIICHTKEPKNEKKLISVGASKVISPYSIGALRMASEMVRPTVTSFLDVMLRDKNKNLRIEELPIPDRFKDRPLNSLPIDDMELTLVLAVREKGDWLYNPPQEHLLKSGSTLILMTSPEELRKLNNIISA